MSTSSASTGARTTDQILTEIVETARTFYAKGLVEGTAGNISGRLPDGTVALTPSSTAYDAFDEDGLAIVDLDGEQVGGGGKPSTEVALHLECYRRYPEVGGVMHSHPLYASMFALAREPIPAAIEEVVVYLGGDIPVCEYRQTGSSALGEEVARNLAERSVCLMANHGMVAIGTAPADALHSSLVAERTAQIVWGARMLGRVHDVPEKVTTDFANVYQLIRETSWSTT